MPQAYHWLRLAAHQREAYAQYGLAKCYREGAPGAVRLDIPRAVRLLRRAWENGFHEAVIITNHLLRTMPGSLLRVCSRPECSEVKKPCHGPRFKRCSGCAGSSEQTYYCSVTCQKKDWPRHCKECLCVAC